MEHGGVVFSVSDAGAGSSSADLERVVDLFQTGSTAGERAGTGLGLALVHATVKARNGTATVTSEVGVGSCFTMTLPGAQPEGEPIGPARRSGFADEQLLTATG